MSAAARCCLPQLQGTRQAVLTISLFSLEARGRRQGMHADAIACTVAPMATTVPRRCAKKRAARCWAKQRKRTCGIEAKYKSTWRKRRHVASAAPVHTITWSMPIEFITDTASPRKMSIRRFFSLTSSGSCSNSSPARETSDVSRHCFQHRWKCSTHENVRWRSPSRGEPRHARHSCGACVGATDLRKSCMASRHPAAASSQSAPRGTEGVV